MPTVHKPRILLLSAYDAGSHKRWREQLVACHPEFHWEVLALPPRFFRWRIRGNALSWLNEPALTQPWDLVIATSMVDLASVKGLHPRLASTSSLLYMHENQFAYPDSGQQHASADPQIVNLFSAISADRVLFNSDWNRRSFLSGAAGFLKKLPDAVPRGVLEGMREKTGVLPVPIEDRLFRSRVDGVNARCPHLLWNHRWEYDKSPDRLLLFLDALQSMGQDFRLSVVGEQFRQVPPAFEQIRARFGGQIQHWGYLEDRQEYDRLLVEADVVVSTALHDFQGLSVLEAMASGCIALVPERLAYPEYVPADQRYPSHPDAAEREARGAAQTLIRILSNVPERSNQAPENWRLSHLKKQYFQEIQTLLDAIRPTETGERADDESHQDQW